MNARSRGFQHETTPRDDKKYIFFKHKKVCQKSWIPTQNDSPRSYSKYKSKYKYASSRQIVNISMPVAVISVVLPNDFPRSYQKAPK